MKHSRIFALLLAVMMVFGCTSALADYPEKAIEGTISTTKSTAAFKNIRKVGDLEIIKSLSRWENSEEATFMFLVEGELDGELVYSNSATITVSGATSSSAVLHNIPEDTIRRRYYMGLKYFFKDYMPACDFWLLADNSKSPFTTIAEGSRSGTTIYDPVKYDIIWQQAH